MYVQFVDAMTHVPHDRADFEQSSYFKSDWVERWQSLKAGTLGAIAISLAFILLIGLHSMFLLANGGVGLPLLTWQDGTQWIVSGAIAALSGFLFAVTYRYVVRHDQNPHLKSGAVGAFSLVRGLAQAETIWHRQANFPILAVIVLESFLLFGIVRVVIDIALQQSWIHPFPQRKD